MRFYFLYGLNPKYPFQGGWTLIHAPDLDAACRIHRVLYPHPDENERDDGRINCADVMDEERFLNMDLLQAGYCGKRMQSEVKLITYYGSSGKHEE